MLPALNGLVLGSKTKPECQTLGAATVKLQDKNYAAISEYFAITIPEYVEGESLQRFLRTFLESYNILETSPSLPSRLWSGITNCI